MSRFTKHHFIFLLLLSGILFPSTGVFASTACVCTTSDKDCREVTVSSAELLKLGCKIDCKKNLCETMCKKELGTKYGSSDFGLDIEGDLKRDACKKTNQTFLATAAASSEKKPAVIATPPKGTITPTLNIDIPGLSFTSAVAGPCTSGGGLTCVKSNFLADYLTGIYQFLIVASISIAIIMVMIGGLQYTLGAGSPGLVSKGKTRIHNAVTGLVLLLGVYLILYTANPQLTILKTIELQNVAGEEMPTDSAVSENVVKGSQGVQCFLDVFGSSKEAVRSQLVRVKILNRTFSVHKLALPAFQQAAAKIESSGYTFKPNTGGPGTWNWRKNANAPESLSLHSFGVAIDFNPKQNGNYPKWKKEHPGVPCPTDLPASLINGMRSSGFRWGGDYKTACDAMHFEWLGPCEKGKPKVPTKTKPTPSQYCCLVEDGNNLTVSLMEECSNQPTAIGFEVGACKK